MLRRAASLALPLAALLATAHVHCASIVGADFDVKPRPEAGAPSSGCSAPMADCNGIASDGCETDTSSNPDHCGGCASPCPANKVCSGSACTDACPSNTKACGRACVDTNTSKEHCGDCDKPCQGSGVCSGGNCGQCAGSPCKLTIPQCGCPDGQGCYADVTDAPSCETSGTKDEGAICKKDTDCRPGHRCATLPGTTVLACRRICEDNSDCSGPGSRCRPSTGTMKLCSIGCELTKNTKCPPGTGCSLDMETSGERYTDCGPAGTLQQNAPCDAAKLCAPGYNCADDNGGKICAHYCRSGVEGDCPSGSNTTCNISSVDNKIGSVIYGSCFP